MKYTVYMHISPSNKLYIGQTQQVPEARFQKGEGYRDNKHFYSAIKKYGWDKFTHQIVATNLTAEQADVLEKELIQQYNSTDPDFGYNFQLGGHFGQVHTEEIRRKISIKLQEAYKDGRIFTEEHKANMKVPKKLSAAEKLRRTEQIVSLNKGKELSDETKQKISEAKKGKPGRQWTEADRKRHSEKMKQVYCAR